MIFFDILLDDRKDGVEGGDNLSDEFCTELMDITSGRELRFHFTQNMQMRDMFFPFPKTAWRLLKGLKTGSIVT